MPTAHKVLKVEEIGNYYKKRESGIKFFQDVRLHFKDKSPMKLPLHSDRLKSVRATIVDIEDGRAWYDEKVGALVFA